MVDPGLILVVKDADLAIKYSDLYLQQTFDFK